MLRYEFFDAETDAGDIGVGASHIAGVGVGASAKGAVDGSGDTAGRSALISVAGTVDRDRAIARDRDHVGDRDRAWNRDRGWDRDRAAPSMDADAEADAGLDSAAAALRSWVVGWTHRFDPLNARRAAEPNPAGVRRLVEAVIDVLLERRPAEQVKRLVSREVFALLTAVAQRRATARFAARSMVRSIQLHTPGPDAVESTVLVQDGPRVRAVALRFERVSTQGYERMNGGATQGRLDAAQGRADATQGRLEWRCTALQFA